MRSTYGDFNLLLGIPMYSFGEITSSQPFGFSFNVLHQPKRYIPIQFGGGISYMGSGSRRENRTLTADITAGSLLIDQINIPLEFRLNNQILNGRFMMRFMAPTRFIKPYIDINGGFNYLWTSTAVYDQSPERYFSSNNDNGLITRKTQESHFTWGAGFGAGMYIELKSNLFLNLNCTYMGGGWARYYDRNQIQNWDITLNVSGASQGASEGVFGEDDLEINGIPKHSRTDMIYAQLGISWIFGGGSGSGNRSAQGSNNRQGNIIPPKKSVAPRPPSSIKRSTAPNRR